MRLLVVEDERSTASMLSRGLREQAYAVDLAVDGVSALGKVSANLYDLILLDVMLPGIDGFELCGRWRAEGVSTPILMLTALSHVSKRIHGLDEGADDYLAKPFEFDELLARIRALLRRGPRLVNPVLQVDDLTLDTRTRQVRRGAKSIELTAKEFALLECLVRDAGRVMGREQISERVWNEDYDACSNLIEVYIQRLRRKIDGHAKHPLIRTRRGEGYFVANEDDPNG
jgi:two-component system, OmpR family, copper resistance phosphate regulon response regulator CusR